MYGPLRPLLFRLDPEQAHHLTLAALRSAGNFPLSNYLLSKIFELSDPRLEVEVLGIRFKNPIGLAAGYDKNGIALKGLSCLGFGHIEVGTITRFAQAGNPRPRIYRVPKANALINNMGFPNAGVDALTPLRSFLLRGEGPRARLGINIGKSKDTPLDQAAQDYCALLKQVADPATRGGVHASADYIALNVSSPNTPGLRQLQSRAAINDLLRAVTRVRDHLTPRVPLLVKISPDLGKSEIDDILAAVGDYGVDGIIATNTTSSRADVAGYDDVSGGLSGAPLRARATEIIRYIARRTEGRLPIVGVGGIFGAADALEKLRAGARLIQVYTGLVYQGPGLVREINLGLVQACEREGVKSVADLRGST